MPAGLTVEIIGLGKTAAAVGATRAVLEHRPGEVINIGSAGALRDGLGGIFTPGLVVNHDFSADLIRAMGYDPQDEIEVPSGDATVLATGDAFIANPAARAALAARAHLVDMEGFAVAWACRELGVPVRLVKHVSDNADEGAMDWPTLVDVSARALGAWVADALSLPR